LKGRKSRRNVRFANIPKLTLRSWRRIIDDSRWPRGKLLLGSPPRPKFASYPLPCFAGPLLIPFLTHIHRYHEIQGEPSEKDGGPLTTVYVG
jgi:hypothetical protein